MKGPFFCLLEADFTLHIVVNNNHKKEQNQFITDYYDVKLTHTIGYRLTKVRGPVKCISDLPLSACMVSCRSEGTQRGAAPWVDDLHHGASIAELPCHRAQICFPWPEERYEINYSAASVTELGMGYRELDKFPVASCLEFVLNARSRVGFAEDRCGQMLIPSSG